MIQTSHKVWKMAVERSSALAHLQRTGTKIALATGVFDIIHPGHIKLLEFASEYGHLIVGVNSDDAVRELKGPTRPLNDQASRMRVLAGLEAVRGVFPIFSTRVDQTILWIKPSAWIKGGDYSLSTLDAGEVSAANHVGAQIVILPTVGTYSTTRIVQSMAQC